MKKPEQVPYEHQQQAVHWCRLATHIFILISHNINYAWLEGIHILLLIAVLLTQSMHAEFSLILNVVEPK